MELGSIGLGANDLQLIIYHKMDLFNINIINLYWILYQVIFLCISVFWFIRISLLCYLIFYFDIYTILHQIFNKKLHISGTILYLLQLYLLYLYIIIKNI